MDHNVSTDITQSIWLHTIFWEWISEKTYKTGFYNHYEHVMEQKLMYCIPKLVSYVLIQQYIQIKYSIIEMPLSNLPIRWYCSLCFFCFLPLYIFASMKLIYNSYTILKLYYSFNDRTNYRSPFKPHMKRSKSKQIKEWNQQLC